jgi:hypothetical protein
VFKRIVPSIPGYIRTLWAEKCEIQLGRTKHDGRFVTIADVIEQIISLERVQGRTTSGQGCGAARSMFGSGIKIIVCSLAKSEQDCHIVVIPQLLYFLHVVTEGALASSISSNLLQRYTFPSTCCCKFQLRSNLSRFNIRNRRMVYLTATFEESFLKKCMRGTSGRLPWPTLATSVFVSSDENRSAYAFRTDRDRVKYI